MARFPYQYANINGIPCIKTQSVVVSDTAVTFKFPGTGIYLVYFDRWADTLQLISNI